MRVDPQTAAAEAVRAARTGSADAAPSSSFAASLSQVTESAEPGAARSARGALASAPAASPPASKASAEAAAWEIPKNERYAPVEGKPYEEIVSGPRNGMFINRSGNSRDGDAFVLVKRGGRDFHIYGKGDKREVVPIRKTAEDTPPVEEKYEPVTGRAFERIVEGRREGMYVNRSGNARDGEVFRLVERGRRELHVYGSGRDRLVVSVLLPEHRREREEAEKASESTSKAAASEPVSTATPVAGGQV